MNKKLSQLSVFGRIRIPASSMIPRRKKGCSEWKLWTVLDLPHAFTPSKWSQVRQVKHKLHKHSLSTTPMSSLLFVELHNADHFCCYVCYKNAIIQSVLQLSRYKDCCLFLTLCLKSILLLHGAFPLAKVIATEQRDLMLKGVVPDCTLNSVIFCWQTKKTNSDNKKNDPTFPS